LSLECQLGPKVVGRVVCGSYRESWKYFKKGLIKKEENKEKNREGALESEKKNF